MTIQNQDHQCHEPTSDRTVQPQASEVSSCSTSTEDDAIIEHPAIGGCRNSKQQEDFLKVLVLGVMPFCYGVTTRLPFIYFVIHLAVHFNMSWWTIGLCVGAYQACRVIINVLAMFLPKSYAHVFGQAVGFAGYCTVFVCDKDRIAPFVIGTAIIGLSETMACMQCYAKHMFKDDPDCKKTQLMMKYQYAFVMMGVMFAFCAGGIIYQFHSISGVAVFGMIVTGTGLFAVLWYLDATERPKMEKRRKVDVSIVTSRTTYDASAQDDNSSRYDERKQDVVIEFPSPEGAADKDKVQAFNKIIDVEMGSVLPSCLDKTSILPPPPHLFDSEVIDALEDVSRGEIGKEETTTNQGDVDYISPHSVREVIIVDVLDVDADSTPEDAGEVIDELDVDAATVGSSVGEFLREEGEEDVGENVMVTFATSVTEEECDEDEQREIASSTSQSDMDEALSSEQTSVDEGEIFVEGDTLHDCCRDCPQEDSKCRKSKSLPFTDGAPPSDDTSIVEKDACSEEGFQEDRSVEECISILRTSDDIPCPQEENKTPISDSQSATCKVSSCFVSPGYNTKCTQGEDGLAAGDDNEDDDEMSLFQAAVVATTTDKGAMMAAMVSHANANYHAADLPATWVNYLICASFGIEALTIGYNLSIGPIFILNEFEVKTGITGFLFAIGAGFGAIVAITITCTTWGTNLMRNIAKSPFDLCMAMGGIAVGVFVAAVPIFPVHIVGLLLLMAFNDIGCTLLTEFQSSISTASTFSTLGPLGQVARRSLNVATAVSGPILYGIFRPLPYIVAGTTTMIWVIMLVIAFKFRTKRTRRSLANAVGRSERSLDSLMSFQTMEVFRSCHNSKMFSTTEFSQSEHCEV